MFLGFITQFGFCGDMHGIQCQSKSDIFVWSLRRVCGWNASHFPSRIQFSDTSFLSESGGDVKATCESEHKEHHDMSSHCLHPDVFNRFARAPDVAGHNALTTSNNGTLNVMGQLFWSWGPLHAPDVEAIIDTRPVVASVLGQRGDARNRRAREHGHCVHADGERGGSVHRDSL